MADTASFFRNRFVQVIVLSGLFLQIGIWVRNFAILLFVMDQTGGDEKAVSLISVAEFAPIFIFSFIGGAFADRWRPKRTMVWSDLLSALSVFAVMATLMTGLWQAIFFATLVSAILSQFSQPSMLKLFKQHVPEQQMQMGMAMFQTMMSIFMIIGPFLGTLVYQNFGINVSIGIMGIAFLLSAGVLTFIPADKKEVVENKGTSIFTEMKEGFRYVMAKPVLKILGGNFAAAGLALGIMQPLTIFLVTENLGMPKENVQWLMMTNGVAMLLGGGLVMGISKKVPPHALLVIGMVAVTIATAVTGLSTYFPLTLGSQFFAGLFLPCIHIGINTIMLKTTESEFIGRANGILNPLFMGMMVVTMSIAGWLKVTFSLTTAFEIAAGLFFIGILLALPLFKMNLQLKDEPANVAKPAEQV
ncbi:putative MFS family arabinose efflux permease [Tumebacillus sp. BK434]|uniref:MFS transporter n=1 Tax=Tumebacillus sp. BK434 TaxID=2512169 RepID=UPI00104D1638|nr:MFS transporter [Tumebacillus sp. BK434]TCP59189.1 putative MFS family arabinose efflux permease [Tumebacillus sp. BK434]